MRQGEPLPPADIWGIARHMTTVPASEYYHESISTMIIHLISKQRAQINCLWYVRARRQGRICWQINCLQYVKRPVNIAAVIAGFNNIGLTYDLLMGQNAYLSSTLTIS